MIKYFFCNNCFIALMYGIKEQIDTITNGYTCSIFQVAKITKKGVWLCSLFFKTIFRLILDEVCIISTRYSVSFS